MQREPLEAHPTQTRTRTLPEPEPCPNPTRTRTRALPKPEPYPNPNPTQTRTLPEPEPCPNLNPNPNPNPNPSPSPNPNQVSHQRLIQWPPPGCGSEEQVGTLSFEDEEAPDARSAWEVIRDDGVAALDWLSSDGLWGETGTPG